MQPSVRRHSSAVIVVPGCTCGSLKTGGLPSAKLSLGIEGTTSEFASRAGSEGVSDALTAQSEFTEPPRRAVKLTHTKIDPGRPPKSFMTPPTSWSHDEDHNDLRAKGCCRRITVGKIRMYRDQTGLRLVSAPSWALNRTR